MMAGRATRLLAGVALCAVPLTLAVICWATYPFSDVIASKTLSTSGLTRAQKSNIQLAAQKLDGIILKPGEQFSFNRSVGPRSAESGFRPAPSYLSGEKAETTGGGICLVSSAMYQVALETGCAIAERVPHLRTIKSVPAGLDATVWYGQADLKFRNDLPCPVRISTKWDNNSLTIAMAGKRPPGYEPAHLNLSVERKTRKELVVELFRRAGQHENRISRDCYIVSQ